jgi:hypothetical protein
MAAAVGYCQPLTFPMREAQMEHNRTSHAKYLADQYVSR